MPLHSPTYKRHLQNLQNEIDAKKLHELQKPNLFNEKTFYREFVKDMLAAEKEVIIYCPFVSKFRSEFFRDTFAKLRRRNIAVFIFTRPLEEHEYLMRAEISCALKDYEELGARIIYLPGFVHEKAAIIDRTILWEGSLNILSQRESREMMRKIADESSAKQVMSYLGLNEKLAEGYKFQYEQLYRNLIASSKKSFAIKIGEFLKGITIPKLKIRPAFSAAVVFLLRVLKLMVGIIGFIFKNSTRS